MRLLVKLKQPQLHKRSVEWFLAIIYHIHHINIKSMLKNVWDYVQNANNKYIVIKILEKISNALINFCWNIL